MEKTKQKAEGFTGAVVAFFLPEQVASQIALPDGEPPEALHVTLAHLGEAAEVVDPNALVSALANFANCQPAIEATLDGLIRFTAKDPNAFCLNVNSPQLADFRHELVECLNECGMVVASNYGFTPHVTLAYIGVNEEAPLKTFKPVSVTFDTLYLELGETRYEFPLSKEPLESVPNYHESLGAINCANCDYSMGNEYCGLYDFTFDPAYVCDSWQPLGEMVKAGARNNRNDYGTIAQINTKAREIVMLTRQLGFGKGAPTVTHPASTDNPTSTTATDGKAVVDTEGQETKKPPVNNALKALSKTEGELRVGNYIALWYGRDLEGIFNGNKNADGSRGEYFTPETKFESDFTENIGRLPVDWEHRMQPEPDGPGEADVFGYVDWATAKADDTGLWVERVLNRRNKYIEALEQLGLFEEGKVGTSSEAIPTGVRKAADGRILTWPLRADTLTVSPMEPRMMSSNQIKLLKALGLPVLDLAEVKRQKALKILQLKRKRLGLGGH